MNKKLDKKKKKKKKKKGKSNKEKGGQTKPLPFRKDRLSKI